MRGIRDFELKSYFLICLMNGLIISLITLVLDLVPFRFSSQVHVYFCLDHTVKCMNQALQRRKSSDFNRSTARMYKAPLVKKFHLNGIICIEFLIMGFISNRI